MADGKVSVLRVKGNLEVDISWENGSLVEATINTFSIGQILLRYANQIVPFALETNCVYTDDNKLNMVK